MDPVHPANNDRYEKEMAMAKSIFHYGLKDHTIPHIVEKNTAWEMWEALTKLYQHVRVGFVSPPSEIKTLSCI